MDVDQYTQTARARAKERAGIAIKAKAKARSTAKAKAKENLATTKNVACPGKGGHLARDCWSRANHDKMVKEVEVKHPNAELDEVCVPHRSQNQCCKLEPNWLRRK